MPGSQKNSTKEKSVVVVQSDEVVSAIDSKQVLDDALKASCEVFEHLEDQFRTAALSEISAYRAAVLQGFAPWASQLWNPKGKGRLLPGCLERMLSKCPSADPSTMSMAIRLYQTYGHDVFMSAESIRGIRRLLEEGRDNADDADGEDGDTGEQDKASIDRKAKAASRIQEAVRRAIKDGMSAAWVAETFKGAIAPYAPARAAVVEPIVVPTSDTSKPHNKLCTCPDCTKAPVAETVAA